MNVITESSKNYYNGLKKERTDTDNSIQRSISDDCEDTAELRLERDGRYSTDQGLLSVDTQLPVDKYIAFQAHVDCETENKGNREKNLEQLNVINPTCEIQGQRTIVKEFGDAEKLCNLGVTEYEHEGTKAASSKKELKKGGEVPCGESEETFTGRVDSDEYIRAAITVDVEKMTRKT